MSVTESDERSPDCSTIATVATISPRREWHALGQAVRADTDTISDLSPIPCNFPRPWNIPDSQADPEVASASWNKGRADGVLPNVTTHGPSGFREGTRYQEYVC